MDPCTQIEIAPLANILTSFAEERPTVAPVARTLASVLADARQLVAEISAELRGHSLEARRELLEDIPDNVRRLVRRGAYALKCGHAAA